MLSSWFQRMLYPDLSAITQRTHPRPIWNRLDELVVNGDLDMMVGNLLGGWIVGLGFWVKICFNEKCI